MRIISGNLKSKKIIPLEGENTRPTTDRVKENIFNIIESMQISGNIPVWAEQAVVDCFCGTGALGLEAISRGANKVDFIDDSPQALTICKKNIVACGVNNRCKTIKANLPIQNRVKFESKKYSLVFLDPPYGENLGICTINSLIENNMVVDDCLFILEEDKKSSEPLSNNLEIIKERIYGRTKISFIKQRQK